jgi:hypothetical protein
MKVKFRKDIFNRWLLVNPDNVREAWSGWRFVDIDATGMPTGGVQVCNFDSRDEAEDYCRTHLLES